MSQSVQLKAPAVKVLHEFLSANRDELIRRSIDKATARRVAALRGEPLEHGVALFLKQLSKTLRLEGSREPASADVARRSELSKSAAQHGRDLLQRGVPVEQVVRDYGNLCQAIIELASELGKPIKTDEFRTLNRCVNDAIADAVAEYSVGKNIAIADQGKVALRGRLGFLAHELRHHVDTATVGFLAIRSRKASIDGATGISLAHRLEEMRSLIDRSLADVQVAVGMTAHKQRLSVAELMTEITSSSSLEAQAKNCTLSTSPVESGLTVEADRHLLISALGNLLQNAFKFTRPGTDISVNAYASAGRILIDVADCCGGLPMGIGEGMFAPFAQNPTDSSGLGRGLAISKHSIEANGGLMRVRDIPGYGCVFTVDLPRT